ncbi:MAG: hypothetical protein SOU37_05265 [Campylobacter lanienae]|nr:hypothetical protein [Campylobacter lanienae]
MGWFNIDYLKDPSFIKSAGGGNAYTAMGDVLSKFGGIINAERDRKYQLEQDRLKNERESKKKIADIAATNALEAQRKAQTLKAQSDMEQGILNGDSLRGYRNSKISLGKERNNILWANHNETKTHHRNTEEIQKSKSGGATSNSGKKILQREIDEKFNSKKYSQNIDDLLNTEL